MVRFVDWSAVVFTLLLLGLLSGCGGRGGGGGGGGNLRPDEAPDFVLLSVSGHNLGDSGDCEWFDPDGRRINCEYLDARGTPEAIIRPAIDRGADVLSLAFGDSFYSWNDAETDEPIVRGFLELLAAMTIIEEDWVADYANPTRVIVAAHSHGVVWAHIALFLRPELPVDLLIDLDGESLSWESDDWSGDLFPGDEWADVILDYSVENDVTWDFDIWEASDHWTVPGLAWTQDIEDVVPDSVFLNLEVASSDFLIQDAEPNYREDGSQEGIYRSVFNESHGGVTYPGSAPINWVSDTIEAVYTW